VAGRPGPFEEAPTAGPRRAGGGIAEASRASAAAETGRSAKASEAAEAGRPDKAGRAAETGRAVETGTTAETGRAAEAGTAAETGLAAVFFVLRWVVHVLPGPTKQREAKSSIF
jgi:hypothetical protein